MHICNPCSECNDVYIGETGRFLNYRTDEHKRALINNDLSNALTLHRNEQGHNFDFKNTKTLRNANNKRTRHIIESACISHFHTITQRPGNINLDKNISYRILKEHSILPEIIALNRRLPDPT